jgi:hypothetical protein
MDGSVLHNNMCVMAHEEAKCLWSSKCLDFILSIGMFVGREKALKLILQLGTGDQDYNHVNQDGGSKFLKMATDAAKQSLKDWEQFQTNSGMISSFTYL